MNRLTQGSLCTSWVGVVIVVFLVGYRKKDNLIAAAAGIPMPSVALASLARRDEPKGVGEAVAESGGQPYQRAVPERHQFQRRTGGDTQNILNIQPVVPFTLNADGLTMGTGPGR